MKVYPCGCTICNKHHKVDETWRQQNRDRLNAKARENYANNKEERKALARERTKKFPEKIRAVNKVNKAVRYGRLNKASACERCDRSDVRLEGHHHKGYQPPNDLDVQWLCRSCHRKADSKCVVL